MNYEILVGDVLDGLAQFADNSVQVVVTSPPYLGLRDYQTGTWEGGSPDCEHNPQKPDGGERADRTLPLGRGGLYREVCGICGARRIDQQIGLEPTLDEYIAKMVAVFREVRRVIRPDGTCWLNIGDSYVGSTSEHKGNASQGHNSVIAKGTYAAVPHNGRKERVEKAKAAGLKPKDLMLVPFRLAIALQADGWWIRSDIVWRKLNPMPESCTDRPTTAHEHIFLLTKSGKYFYDQYATREKADYDGRKDTQMKGSEKYSDAICPGNQPQTFALRGHERWPNTTDDGERGRNSRSVWSIPTFAFPEAHFATYPPELVRRCLLAGLPKHGSCPKCGKGWVRKVEREKCPLPISFVPGEHKETGNHKLVQDWLDAHPPQSLGHEPDCDCGLDPVPAVVLDPFSGSGTTGVVALKMGARYIGIELSSEYAEMSRKRIERETGGLFDFDANPQGSEPEAVTGVDGNLTNGGAV